MISPTEPFTLGDDTRQFAGAISDRLRETLARNDRRLVDEYKRWFGQPLSLLKISEWLEQSEIYLETDATRGRERWEKKWSFAGREYMREPIDLVEDPERRFLTRCWGTGSGKTTADYGLILHELYHNPFSGLYVMPAATGSGSASEIAHEIIAILDASPAFTGRLPTGAARKTGLTRTRIEFGGNNVWFVGGHSTSKLGGKRCRIVFIGEQDKMKEQLGQEASADYLAGERTKGMSNSLIVRSSSPSIEERGIWKALLGGGDSSGSDCRRRFLPCPHCNPQITPITADSSSFKGWFILIKDMQYNTALPTKTPQGVALTFAEKKWDKEAKRRDGAWDMDRVIRSTRFECPHCGGHVRDEHRLWMDKHGVWIPTRRGETGHFGHQLSSYYAPLGRDEFGQIDFKSTWGGMAQKFLNSIENGTIGGYINSDLAEVNAHQEAARGETIEISSDNSPRVSSVLYWPELSVDRQAKYPGFWHRTRRWTASVLRPQMLADARKIFLDQMPGELKTISSLITLSEKLNPADVINDIRLYSPDAIMAQIHRTDHWPKIADWLIGNGLVGKKLTEFFQVEFQTDLIRMLEFICKQPAVNVMLGKQGDSELVEFGSADSWEEIDDVQRRWKIASPDVICDARYGDMDQAEVFAECFRRCPQTGFCYYSPIISPFGPRGKFSRAPMAGYRPFAEWGWTPCLGYPEHKVWPGKDKIRLPFVNEVNDPFVGKMEARQFYQYVFKFDAQWALSELDRIRKRYSFTIARDCKITGHNAQMQPVTLKDYELHMKGYYWNAAENRWDAPGKKGGSQSRTHPNHLYDCEKNGAARAVWKGIFRYQREASTGSGLEVQK